MFSPTSTSDSRLPEVFRKVRAMTATVSRMQTSKSEGPKYHNKSSSLPSPSTSNYHRSPSPPLPPSRLNRNYTQKREFRKKDEDTKGLLRSKTMSSRISVESSSSSSSRQQSSRPSRTSSQASRVSTVSTTSTITPMKTRWLLHSFFHLEPPISTSVSHTGSAFWCSFFFFFAGCLFCIRP